MLELDRWAVTKLNGLIEKCFAAYDNYEYHVISHAINDFCVVEVTHSLKGAPFPSAPTAVSREDWNQPRYWSSPSM